jgi:hypothetical protein
MPHKIELMTFKASLFIFAIAIFVFFWYFMTYRNRITENGSFMLMIRSLPSLIIFVAIITLSYTYDNNTKVNIEKEHRDRRDLNITSFEKIVDRTLMTDDINIISVENVDKNTVISCLAIISNIEDIVTMNEDRAMERSWEVMFKMIFKNKAMSKVWEESKMFYNAKTRQYIDITIIDNN